MKIDFVSDVACPWCAIGLHSLERALERLPTGIPVELRFQPFELNPSMPPEGEDLAEHLGRKYGMAREQVQQGAQALAQRGAAVGFTFGPRSRIWNTFDAHRLLHWAGVSAGVQAQRALKHALLSAYHGRGENPGSREVLRRCAAEAGLDPDAAAAVIDDPGRHAEDVRAQEAHFQRLGIHAVPSVIIDDRHLIQGGQPPEVFERALRSIAAESGGTAS